MSRAGQSKLKFEVVVTSEGNEAVRLEPEPAGDEEATSSLEELGELGE